MLKTVTYDGQDGSKQTAAYITGGNAYTLTGSREKFAKLMARGQRGLEAYLEAFDQIATDEASQESAKNCVRDLLNDTSIVLRIQELKRPVLRKLKQKIEYGLQHALAQCQIAWDLAYAQGDVKGLLAAIRMQSDLAKLLSQELNVNHRYGVLDDAATETLLELRKEIEVRQAKQKKLLAVRVDKIETVPETPHQGRVGEVRGAPPMAVPNSESPNFDELL